MNTKGPNIIIHSISYLFENEKPVEQWICFSHINHLTFSKKKEKPRFSRVDVDETFFFGKRSIQKRKQILIQFLIKEIVVVTG